MKPIHVRPYEDKFGMLVQLSNRDGGDTSRNMGMYWLGACAIEELSISEYTAKYAHPGILFEEADLDFEKLQRSDGRMRRHPDIDKWYGAWDRFSRDQMIPVLAAYAALGLKQRAWKFFKDHLKNGWLLFSTNTKHNYMYPTLKEHLAKSTPDVQWNYSDKMPDLTVWDVWALYIRCFQSWYLWPLLVVFDGFTVIDAIIHRYLSDSKHVEKFVSILVVGDLVMPTPTMRLAHKITSADNIISKMYRYWDGEDPPWMASLFAPTLRRICSK